MACTLETPNYAEIYAKDPNMKLLGEDVQSDDEHKVFTIRHGNVYVKTRVKRIDKHSNSAYYTTTYRKLS